jgi:hypothetical protein
MDSETPRRKKNSTDGNAERQRRYREHHKTHALELKGEVYSQLRAICQQKGWTIGQAVAEALKLLQAEVAAEARSARTAEIYKQAVEEKRKSDEANLLSQPSKPRKPKPPVQPEDADGQGSLL